MIEDYNRDISFVDHKADLKTKSAVERQLGIIGEAVNNHRKLGNPELENSKEIIAFRNRLVHAYNNLEDEIIWAVIIRHLPALKSEVILLLQYNKDKVLVSM